LASDSGNCRWIDVISVTTPRALLEHRRQEHAIQPDCREEVQDIGTQALVEVERSVFDRRG
jgi:hypothetical protein